ncbi:MAG TPA: hypothetical protein VKU82_02990 [Planctomycetaceae bacterium]|nr:hypothetical protein [Planctomycetaceae bacterium]
MFRTAFVSSLLVLSAALIGHHARCDESPTAKSEDAEESAAAKERLAFMIEALGEYNVEVSGEQGTETAKLLSKPALRWSNTVSGTKDGIVGVWTSGGRPEVVVQFSTPGGWIHEFCSTSTHPLKMTRKGTTVWSPKVAGVELKNVPKAPPPSESAVRRLGQMRQIAERFEVVDDFHPIYADPKTERHTLRLLTKPLYRYSPKGDLIDGALFGLVITTDPEALLMVEAYNTDDGPQWRYALARMTVYRLTGKLDGAEVWSAHEKLAGQWRFDEPYFVGVHR